MTAYDLNSLIEFIFFRLVLGAIVISLIFYIHTITRFSFTEIFHPESLPQTPYLERPTLLNLALGSLSRRRIDVILLLIAALPFLIGAICLMYKLDSYGANSAEYCYTSPFNHIYCEWDAAPSWANSLEGFWILSCAISTLGILFIATILISTLVLLTRNQWLAAIGSTVITLPSTLLVVVMLAPEGYLLLETVYRNIDYETARTIILQAGTLLIAAPTFISIVAYIVSSRYELKKLTV